MMSSPVRSSVRSLGLYTLEPRTAEVKLDQNESPFDLPMVVKRQIVERMMVSEWNRYPSFAQERLPRRLAAEYGLDPAEILVGNGSNELLVAVIQTLVDAETTVIIPTPAFSLYEQYARAMEGRVVRVPIDPGSGALPVEELARSGEASRERTVILLSSPGNPTGGALREGDLERLLETGAVVVLDRAYGEFTSRPFPRLDERLIVLSSFSKAWGLAGLRIGWLAARRGLCDEIRKVKLPYSLSILNEAAALAVLDHPEALRARVDAIVTERERVAASLRSEGVEVFPSEANFLLFRVPDALGVFEGLLERDVLVRDVSRSPELSGCLRVSIGSADQNDRFLQAMRELSPGAGKGGGNGD
jgi:histidinol-phosphate aminotransferase